jgi:Tfp pilus assembly protein PilO
VRKTRRQVLMRILERIGLGLVVLDVVFYFAAFRPVRTLVNREEQHYASARREALGEQARVAQLEKFRAALPDADKKVESFLHDHIAPRRSAFSHAADLLHDVTEASGAELSDVRYKLGTEKDEPLVSLNVDMNLQGSFSDLLKFAHALETADDLVLIREFTFVPGDNGELGLNLKAEMYLTP